MADLEQNLEPEHKQNPEIMNEEPKDNGNLDPTLPCFISVGTPWTKVTSVSTFCFRQAGTDKF
jgi:hypothetical protein